MSALKNTYFRWGDQRFIWGDSFWISLKEDRLLSDWQELEQEYLQSEITTSAKAWKEERAWGKDQCS